MVNITLGPAQPRLRGYTGRQLLGGLDIINSLARLSARFARTTVLDEIGHVVWTSDVAQDDVELF